MENFTSYIASLPAYLPRVVMGVAILLLALLISGWLARYMAKPLQSLSNSQLIQLVIRRALRTLIILFGLYVFLRLAGLTEFAVAIISGTGLVGLIIGFAFKDIAENFISSILLSIQRPFKIGDVIETQGHTGVIKQVTSRATTLVDFDGNHIQIPNATIYKNIVKNFTANPNMRGSFAVGIGYDSQIEEAQRLALHIIKESMPVLSKPEPQILVDKLDSSTINLTCYFWINSHKFSVFKVKSALMKRVCNGFTDSGISMPDDKRERILLNTESTQQPTNVQAGKQHVQHADNDDLETDVDDIREQAAQARDPEQGENIL